VTASNISKLPKVELEKIGEAVGSITGLANLQGKIYLICYYIAYWRKMN
jgi:hypothetical protein